MAVYKIDIIPALEKVTVQGVDRQNKRSVASPCRSFTPGVIHLPSLGETLQIKRPWSDCSRPCLLEKVHPPHPPRIHWPAGPCPVIWPTVIRVGAQEIQTGLPVLVPQPLKLLLMLSFVALRSPVQSYFCWTITTWWPRKILSGKESLE